mgnify:CR=1 FL=1
MCVNLLLKTNIGTSVLYDILYGDFNYDLIQFGYTPVHVHFYLHVIHVNCDSHVIKILNRCTEHEHRMWPHIMVVHIVHVMYTPTTCTHLPVVPDTVLHVRLILQPTCAPVVPVQIYLKKKSVPVYGIPVHHHPPLLSSLIYNLGFHQSLFDCSLSFFFFLEAYFFFAISLNK